MINCPVCKSSRILHLRHDMDWGNGNSGGLINLDEYYIIDDFQYYDNVPDINIYKCLNCNFIWEVDQDSKDVLLNIVQHLLAEIKK